ncbi:MAG TPA: glycosyl hydrolase family 57 [Verrucomicrobiae bacterium]|nr:glycosyl hydrolase family 57 [Verrucomicrobiae bacterium]
MTPEPIPEIIEGLPNISGWEAQVEAASTHRGRVFLERTPIRLDRLQSAFGVALHMHQPLVFDDGDLHQARMIGNLQYMMERQHIHGNHDAPVFAWCYTRIADFIRELVNAGRHPRVMLDYSGELLFGLRQMQRGDIIDNLRSVTVDERYWPHVEWLGTMWGHAVVPSTPVPDVGLHIRAWQHHFAAIFGWGALGRVRGFSPPEMHLPNHPDVCFEYVRALRTCGYEWLAVQEHSVEELDGHGLRERYLPRRLIARNSKGEETSITAVIKTQGSDTKLIGQMQPFHEAQGQHPRNQRGASIPPLVFQISDGENGGVMMNEFPQNYNQVWHQVGSEGVVGLNVTEYLELLGAAGVTERDFEPIQPLHQHKIWKQVGDPPTPERVNQLIEELRQHDHRFTMEGASWTNNLSWVRGYESVLDPMNKLSALFHETTDHRHVDKRSRAYRNALLHLLATQTSCYRYWGGQGRWTDYARELCRRGTEILKHDL